MFWSQKEQLKDELRLRLRVAADFATLGAYELSSGDDSSTWSGLANEERAAPKDGPFDLNRRRPTLPGPCGPSTIGAEGLNCSVRNGKRCFPLAMATETGDRRTALSPDPQNCTMASTPVWKKSSVKPSTD